MNTPRTGTAGATRVCPHCKATVLESAAVCPGCRHHLRFNTDAGPTVADDGYCALNIDGSITPRETVEPCEYCVVLDIRNERGEQVVRQVVGVGVLQPGESRRVNLTVDMLPVRLQSPVKNAVGAKPAGAAAASAAALKAASAPGVLKPPPQPPAMKPIQPLNRGNGHSGPGSSPRNANDRMKLFRKP